MSVEKITKLLNDKEKPWLKDKMDPKDGEAPLADSKQAKAVRNGY
jgi:hypothetical protein